MKLSATFAFAALAACSSSHGDSPDGSNGDGQSGDGPVILSLTSTVSRITTSDTVTIVAVVTEPSGLDNLVGGKLTSHDGALTYGAFVATTQGTYNLPLAWSQIGAVSPLEFTGHSQLVLRATFYNKAGKQTSQDVPAIELYCDSGSAPDAACASKCVDLETPQFCGACNLACADESWGQLHPTVTCAQATCRFSGTFDPRAQRDVTGALACGAATPSAACTSVGATMSDGTTRTLDCTTSFNSFVPNTMQTRPANAIYCECGSSAQWISKNTDGACAAKCPAASPCTATIVRGNGWILHDSCGAPYRYADWDTVHAPITSVTVNVMPDAMTPSCVNAPTPH